MKQMVDHVELQDIHQVNTGPKNVGGGDNVTSTDHQFAFSDPASMAHLRGTIESAFCEDHVTIARLSLITEN
jgi:hypothetical protein